MSDPIEEVENLISVGLLLALVAGGVILLVAGKSFFKGLLGSSNAPSGGSGSTPAGGSGSTPTSTDFSSAPDFVKVPVQAAGGLASGLATIAATGRTPDSTSFWSFITGGEGWDALNPFSKSESQSASDQSNSGALSSGIDDPDQPGASDNFDLPGTGFDYFGSPNN